MNIHFFVAKETITTTSDKTTLGTTFMLLQVSKHSLFWLFLPVWSSPIIADLFHRAQWCVGNSTLYHCFLNCYDWRTNSITIASHENLDALFIYGFKGISNSFRLSVPMVASLDKQLSFPTIHFLLVRAFRLTIWGMSCAKCVLVLDYR